MFYRKRIPAKTTRNYKISLSSFATRPNADVDENLMSTNRAKIYYNYDVKNGALKTGIGFEDLTLPNSQNIEDGERQILLPENINFNGVWHFKYYSQTNNQKDHFLIYYGTDNNLYWCKLVSLFPQSFLMSEDVQYPTRPNALQYRLNGEDVMMFTENTSDMMVWKPEYSAYIVGNAPKVVSMCLHYERLFAIVEGERIQLRFSDDLDPTNWENSPTEGGYIELVDERGPMSKVVSFEDYLYVFRDFGISRVSAFGDQSEFSVSGVHTSSGKIYGGSVAVCGNKIVYLSKNGLHYFDGVSSEKLDLNIDSLFDGVTNDNACSAFLDNKYYLACRLNFQDQEKVGCENYSGGYTNNAIVELDLIDGTINIVRGVDVVSMTSIEEGNISKLICCFGGEYGGRLGQLTHSGEMFGTPLKKVWKSPKSDMGYCDKLKVVKKISLITKHEIVVKISTEKESKSFKMSGANSPQTIRPNMVGKLIEISIETNLPLCDVSKPEIIVGVVG